MAEYYGVVRTPEYIMHYGVRGMKWGVRKALVSGNSRKLQRQFNKASRKLEKLETRATSGKKYAKRAALLGAGAAAAGSFAGVGPSLGKWGTSHSINRGISGGLADFGRKIQAGAYKGTQTQKALAANVGTKAWKVGSDLNIANRNNNTYARLAAGALGAGLAAGAARNAYKAATTKKAAQKAAAWKGEMQKAFKGTQYENQVGNRQGKKRRR